MHSATALPDFPDFPAWGRLRRLPLHPRIIQHIPGRGAAARGRIRRSALGDWGQIIGQAVVAAGQYAAAHEQKQAAKEGAKAQEAVAEAQKQLALIQGQIDVTKGQQSEQAASEAARQKLLYLAAAGLFGLLGLSIYIRKRKK